MAAHIPMIISKETPKNVLLIGFGTGLTASRFLYYGIDDLLCVDIEQAVFNFAKSEFSADFLANPKVRTIAEDGRNTIRRKNQNFDIISVEIGQIFRPYLATFYTKEFYENAAKNLSENGIISQFVPIASFDFATFQSIIKTFLSVFENAQLWFNGSEFLLLGTKGEFGNLSSERANQIFSENREVLIDLQWSYWGGTLYPLSDKRVLAANFLMGRYHLASLSYEGEIFIDDLPKLEYYTAIHRQNAPFIDSIKNGLSPIQNIIPEIFDANDIDGIEGIRERNLGDIVASELFSAYIREKFAVPALLEKALEYNPLNIHALRELANIYYEKKEYEKSAQLFDKALKLDTQSSYLHRQYALALIKLDYRNFAIDNLLTAIEISPNDFIAHTMLAGLMLERSHYDLAVRHISIALEINPNYGEALRMQEYLNSFYKTGIFEE
jgi:tetratricopeptide (TPR) repeat protein